MISRNPDGGRDEPVPLIPRSVLFADPQYFDPKISPDGTRLGFLAPRDGVLNVYVGPLDDPSAARPLTNDRGQGIRAYGFCRDDRTVWYLQDADGDENWLLYLVDLHSGEHCCVTPFEQVMVYVLGHTRWHPTQMLLAINKDNPELHDVYRLDLTDRSLTKVQTNPGFFEWLVDPDLAVRGGIAMPEDGGNQIHLRDEQTGEFTPWLAIPPEDALPTAQPWFSRDGATVYLISSLGANTGRLLAVDLASGKRTVLAEDPAYDVTGVERDPLTWRPQAVHFYRERQEWVALDPGFAAELTRVRQRLDVDGEIWFARTELADRIWLLGVAPSDGPAGYYRYRRDTAELALLFHDRAELNDYQLARKEPFAFTARDGLRIRGYVSYPPGVPARGLPAVVNVHGGPWDRDIWAGSHDEPWWLADRGYACVQVNFRGSTGYGKAFVNAGDKQWARAMHTDLLDAIDHLAAQGAIDPARVAIMGTSYGGYAALVGAAFTPDRFRCAIALCGWTNLLTALASIPPYWQPWAWLLHTRIGDPDTEKDLLRERSPLFAADQITIPVLVAQGANDVRVKQAEAEQIVAALRANDVPHEYLLFDDEGHGLYRPENRERYIAAAERFLAEQLGGRMEP